MEKRDDFNPFLGLRYKAAVNTTDLPLVPDQPVDFGLQEFCKKCKKCADQCPSQSIPKGEKIMHNGYETWKLDVISCTIFRLTKENGSGCGRCIKVCPWNKSEGWIHNLVRWNIRNLPFLNRLMVKGDDIFGYGKPDMGKKWWFDLVGMDGRLRVPRNSKGKWDL